MKRTFFAEGITIFFVLLFLYTGLMKFMDMSTFQHELSGSPLAAWMTGIISWLLPVSEIIISIALIVPKWRLKGLYATFVLLSAFTIYVFIALVSMGLATCSCGGIIENLSAKQHVIFNIACLILSFVGILITRKHQLSAQFKWWTGSSVVSLWLVVGWLLFTAFRAPVVRKTGMEGKEFPAVNLLLPDSATYFNSKDIPPGKPFIVVGFDPWCAHCQDLVVDIKAHSKELKSIHIYYITPFPFQRMRRFYDHFRLANFPSITVGRDTANTFFSYFNITGIPYAGIFDNKRRLRSVMIGQMTALQLFKLAEY